MMFPIGFTRQPEFLAFKADVNHPSALEFLFRLVERCQSEKKTEFYLPSEYIGGALGLPEGVDSEAAKASLIRHGMITPLEKPDWFTIDIYVRHNAGLISRWENGMKGGRPKTDRVSTKTAAPEKELAQTGGSSKPLRSSYEAPSAGQPKAAAPASADQLDEDVPF